MARCAYLGNEQNALAMVALMPIYSRRESRPKMRFVLNLRRDLAKPDDREPAARLESVWRAFEVAEHQLKLARSPATVWYSERGPIRHQFAYMFTSILGIQARRFGPWHIGPPFPNVWGGPLLKMHLNLCEIRDLNDEIERRRPKRLT
jgi:hypothetical protein